MLDFETLPSDLYSANDQLVNTLMDTLYINGAAELRGMAATMAKAIADFVDGRIAEAVANGLYEC